MTIKLITALVLGFFLASGVGAFLVPWLRKIKAGQATREDGPTWHMKKSGTPTMGGSCSCRGSGGVPDGRL